MRMARFSFLPAAANPSIASATPEGKRSRQQTPPPGAPTGPPQSREQTSLCTSAMPGALSISVRSPTLAPAARFSRATATPYMRLPMPDAPDIWSGCAAARSSRRCSGAGNGRLVGDPVPLAERVGFADHTRFVDLSASATGVLLYGAGNTVMRRAAWLKRDG